MAVKILMVEDDVEQAALFVQVLVFAGYQVTAVETVEEAQARLETEPFDLLLADWDLGPNRMQGDELIRWTKTQYPELKTVLFSNHMEVNEVAAACGADAAFRKVEGIVPLRQLVARLAPRNGHA